RIVERTNKGIRSADRKTSQGDVSGDRAARTSERGRRPNRADLCADDRRPTSIPKEPRRRMLCGAATWAEELRRQRATAAHQQTRGRVSTDAAGAGSTLHFGTFWGR